MCKASAWSLSLLLLILVLCAPSARAAADDDDVNYTTQRLLVFNERDEVLLQLNHMGWSTPGHRYDQPLALRPALDALARRYGIRIADVRLAGMLSYDYRDAAGMSTRTHYSARLAGGAPVPPEGIRALRWFPREQAIAMIAEASQKSPPSFVEMTTRMLRQPETVWGGTWRVWQEDGIYRSQVIEPMYPLVEPRSEPVPP